MGILLTSCLGFSGRSYRCSSDFLPLTLPGWKKKDVYHQPVYVCRKRFISQKTDAAQAAFTHGLVLYSSAKHFVCAVTLWRESVLCGFIFCDGVWHTRLVFHQKTEKASLCRELYSLHPTVQAIARFPLQLIFYYPLCIFLLPIACFLPQSNVSYPPPDLIMLFPDLSTPLFSPPAGKASKWKPKGISSFKNLSKNCILSYCVHNRIVMVFF